METSSSYKSITRTEPVTVFIKRKAVQKKKEKKREGAKEQLRIVKLHQRQTKQCLQKSAWNVFALEENDSNTCTPPLAVMILKTGLELLQVTIF